MTEQDDQEDKEEYSYAVLLLIPLPFIPAPSVAESLSFTHDQLPRVLTPTGPACAFAKILILQCRMTYENRIITGYLSAHQTPYCNYDTP